MVYVRLDTLEMKVPREEAWATSGGSLSQALMVQGKKVFDLYSVLHQVCMIIPGCGLFIHCMVGESSLGVSQVLGHL